jgi:hypothetical protein
MCAIKNVNRIRLIRPFKNLLSFKKFTFFSHILAARFPLYLPFKYYMQLLRRGRRLIRKGKDITGMIHG